MASPFLGQIMMFGGTFAPQGYVKCDGSLLRISDYPALYDLIGTTYGGDGVNTFGIPDLRARAPIHQGVMPGGSVYVLGATGGAATVGLRSTQVGTHTHALWAVAGRSNSTVPDPTFYLSDEGPGPYVPGTYHTLTQNHPTVLADSSIGMTGSGEPHPNVQPVLTIMLCMAVTGFSPPPPAT